MQAETLNADEPRQEPESTTHTHDEAERGQEARQAEAICERVVFYDSTAEATDTADKLQNAQGAISGLTPALITAIFNDALGLLKPLLP